MKVDLPKAEAMIRDEFTIPKMQELVLTPTSSPERVTEHMMAEFAMQDGRALQILKMSFVGSNTGDPRPEQLFDAFCEWFVANRERIAAECPATTTE